jgi:hypothetical protein
LKVLTRYEKALSISMKRMPPYDLDIGAIGIDIAVYTSEHPWDMARFPACEG